MSSIATSPVNYYHCDVILIMTYRTYGSARGARSPRSHYDVILSVTSFATELATPTVTDVRRPMYVTYGHLTAFNIIEMLDLGKKVCKYCKTNNF